MNAICGDCFANAAIRSCFGDTMVRFRCICRGSQKRVHDPTSRFPPLAPAGRCSPASAVLSRRYDFLTPIPPHFVSFAWWYLNVHSLSSLPGGRVRRRSLELVTRFSSRDLTEETTGPPKVLENPNCPFAHVQSTPAGLLAPDHKVKQRGPWYVKSKGSDERSFDAQ